MLISKKEESAQILQSKYYQGEMDLKDMQANFGAMDAVHQFAWSNKMKDGSLLGMLDSVTKLFVEFGAMKDPLPASKYFDFGLSRADRGRPSCPSVPTLKVDKVALLSHRFVVFFPSAVVLGTPAYVPVRLTQADCTQLP